jgi:hypothetical protein
MKAFITFIRTYEKDIHMLGIKNPDNIDALKEINLISGQPVVSILENDVIVGLYLIKVNGEVFQVKGNIDFLFDLKEMSDISSINVKKYNAIRYYLINTFYNLSMKEFGLYEIQLDKLENTIFYNYLHADFEISQLKTILIREINRSDLSYYIKKRLVTQLRNVKPPTKKILRKKIDIDLSGYSIYINTLIQ